MIERLNPGKFKTTIMDKKHCGLTYKDLNVYHHTVKSIWPIELLEIHLDDNSKFILHISSMYRSPGNHRGVFRTLSNIEMCVEM